MLDPLASAPSGRSFAVDKNRDSGFDFSSNISSRSLMRQIASLSFFFLVAELKELVGVPTVEVWLFTDEMAALTAPTFDPTTIRSFSESASRTALKTSMVGFSRSLSTTEASISALSLAFDAITFRESHKQYPH
jgi:hypothetical protein